MPPPPPQEWLERVAPLVRAPDRRRTRHAAAGRDGPPRPRAAGGRAELAGLLAEGQGMGLARGRAEFAALGKLVAGLDNWRSQVRWAGGLGANLMVGLGEAGGRGWGR